MSVVAPAGYGKTTLLTQWAQANGLAFAWVSVDEADNDPKVLLSHVAEALDGVEPIDGRVFDALASPGSSVPGAVVPRLGSALWSMSSPVALVLDDVHALGNGECRAAVSVLADHVPEGSRLVLAGRTTPPLPVGRLRAEGKVVEIGPGDLSLSLEEASALLRNAEVTLGGDEAADLHRRTEGWPAGLYLAALYVKEGGALPGAAASFDGGDRFVSEYVESEFLARVSPRRREFLTRAAVLEQMGGPLCEAVLGMSGAGTELAELAQSNLLLVPLDRRGDWYRYHRLFRDMLLADLQRQDPGLIPVLRRRAARWCLHNGLPEQALEYSIAAGDTDSAAGLVGLLAVPVYRQGRVATLQRWLRWLEEQGAIGEQPLVLVVAAFVSVLTGRPVQAERWADVVDRWPYQDARAEDGPAQAWAALLRALMCRHGVEQMRADAEEALRRLAEQGLVSAGAVLMLGIARVLTGDLEGGDVCFEDASSMDADAGIPEVLPIVLAERALVAMARGEWHRAEALAGQAGAAMRRARVEDSFATPLVCAAQARVAMHQADTAAARRELVAAQRPRPLLTYALPHLAVQARIELARVHLALADQAGAKTLLREADNLLRRRPDLGNLAAQAKALRAHLGQQHGSAAPRASALTTAELRLLPLLSTHLTFAEMGEELFLSHHTVKSQAVSIYRKLGAATRSQAVAGARELGLLEG